jgi:hypothetical protein
MDRRQVLSALGGTALGLAAESNRVPHVAAGEVGGNMKPVKELCTFLCAFHLAKKDPKIVIEALHYCSTLTEEIHQCVIFDAEGKKLLGVEYIITDKLYRDLPDEEKKYYHPHTYEVISGQLIAPDMAKAAEKKYMKDLLSTWGKTWHTWPDPKSPLPMGEPLLMWSATKDGHVPAEMIRARDEQFHVSTGVIGKRRAELGPLPQIDFPRSVNAIGRQWSIDGPDEPRRR